MSLIVDLVFEFLCGLVFGVVASDFRGAITIGVMGGNIESYLYLNLLGVLAVVCALVAFLVASRVDRVTTRKAIIVVGIVCVSVAAFLILAGAIDGIDLWSDPNWPPLTDNLTGDFSPVWSPNSQLIAFMSERNGNPDIFLMNADGSQPTPLIVDAAIDISPTFSPETQEVAFVSNRSGAFDLYVLDGASGDVRRLTEGLGTVASPNWSPNGRYIVFTANAGSGNEVFIVRPDGSDLQQ